MEGREDRWVAACGGLEEPTVTRAGRRILYVFNPAQMRHAWLDLGTDLLEFENPFAGI